MACSPLTIVSIDVDVYVVQGFDQGRRIARIRDILATLALPESFNLKPKETKALHQESSNLGGPPPSNSDYKG